MGAISNIVELLLEMKGQILESIVCELRDDVVGIRAIIQAIQDENSDAEDNEVRNIT